MNMQIMLINSPGVILGQRLPIVRDQKETALEKILLNACVVEENRKKRRRSTVMTKEQQVLLSNHGKFSHLTSGIYHIYNP